ncbi:hypothetical protein ABL78_2935 [Leptomonas seymouri]|uniref:Uncharacterized protein n=1 Tax=Leptomonas seymouri TaxID=5684 RepID=A0A0N0P6T7_LEPSE|nr:hypothetical protein ABL78_2935 [Leptomonas seymouri]|eukprot:KPI87999.1 hypothetical protein ABL78_2935 [Leptomonas seymouri]
MYHSRPHHVTISPVWCCNAGSETLSRALLRRWRDMRAALPASKTAPATALLRETLTHLEANEPATTTTCSLSATTQPTPTTPALFRSQRDAQVIWSVVQRQRVSWLEALLLLPWQLQSMPAAQRAFVRQRISSTPWDVAQVVLAAQNVVEDARLVQQFRALKQAPYMVEFARLVSAALRERPSLPEGLLPVPYEVMLHGYELGRRSPEDAAIALELSKHLTLVGQSAPSRSAEERLVMGHASLEGQVGNWAAALEVVTQSRAVRLSIRKGFERFVRSMQREDTKESADVPMQSLESGLSSERDLATPFHTIAVVSPAEAVRSQPSSSWLSALHAFLAQPPDRQTYAEAQSLLATLPRDRTQHPDFVILAVEVLRHAARRMYAGTLTRRLVSCTARGQWSFALILASAAGCYDLAVPLIPFLPYATELPPDLKDFHTTTLHIQQKPEGSVPAGPSPLPLTRAAAESLTYPQALAYALEGDGATRQALLSFCPQSQSRSRLRSLLVAARRFNDNTAAAATAEEEGGEDMPDVDCWTFQSLSLSQLVCAVASEKRQRYFRKVIPASMRAHHFCLPPLSKAPSDSAREEPDSAVEASPCAAHLHTRGTEVACACYERLQQWRMQAATTPAACTALLMDLSAFLRATHAVEGAPVLGGQHAKPRLTEDVFLRWVSAVSAWGAVQLPAAERSHWPVAVLKAACLLRVTLDACLVRNAARSIPSTFVDAATLTLPSILAAHTLLGNWQAGLQVCARLERKEKEGAVQLEVRAAEGKLRTLKHKAPSPTLREAMAQVGYVAPVKEAVRHWAALDASSAALPVPHSTSFPLILIELRQFEDTRQLCEELRRVDAVALQRNRVNAKLEHLSRRRMLLGAAFSLLDDETALKHVVRTGAQRQVRACDLDCHGLQRLLSVLPAGTVVRVLVSEASEGRCAHEHWLLSCMSHPNVSADEVRRLASLRPTSAVLSAVCCFRVAVEKLQPVQSLKALKRIAEMVVDSPARHALLMCMARLMRIFLSNDDLMQACLQSRTQQQQSGGASITCVEDTARDAPAAKESLQQAQMLFNRLQEVEELSGMLKLARRTVRPFINVQPGTTTWAPSSLSTVNASPCATWVILSSLQVAISRASRLPIPASFTSRLFFLASAMTPVEWRAALFFFNELRHPTDAERVALVQALRPCGAMATSILLPHRRFMRHLPEQLMLWADEAGGPSKWERSIALLKQTQGNETELRTVDGVSQPTVTREGNQGATPANPSLSSDVQAAISKWNSDECFRAAQLLRRQGFVKLPAKRCRSLNGAQITEISPHARRQVEAILELLQRGIAEAEAVPAPPSPQKRSTAIGVVPGNDRTGA